MGILNFGSNKSSNTVIDKELIIRGHININRGGLHIQGIVEGNVISSSDGETRVVVGKHGLVQGNISATTVVVIGKVVGNIKCANAEILVGSSVDGDIQYQHILMDGGKITGKLAQIPSFSKLDKTEKPKKNLNPIIYDIGNKNRKDSQLEVL